MRENTELTIFGDGEQSRDFVYIEDVIQALLLIATSEQSFGEVYNVGTGVKNSINDLTKFAQKFTNKELSIKFDDVRQGDIKDSVSDISKLKDIGYSPKFDLSNGMKKYLNYEFK